jgi:hypothetical protein
MCTSSSPQPDGTPHATDPSPSTGSNPTTGLHSRVPFFHSRLLPSASLCSPRREKALSRSSDMSLSADLSDDICCWYAASRSAQSLTDCFDVSSAARRVSSS